MLTGEPGGQRGETEFQEAAIRGTVTTASVGNRERGSGLWRPRHLGEEPRRTGPRGAGAGSREGVQGAGASAPPVLENTLGSASATGTKCPWPLGAARVFQEQKANRKE